MKRICSVTGCDKPYQAKGFCSPHYRQERAKQPCGVEGCDRPFYQAGFCAGHYARKLAHGDPLAGKTFDGEGLRWLEETVKRCIADEVDECVEQSFHDSESGYATVFFGGKHLRMHVVSLILSGRDAPRKGFVTRHLCGNGTCINPRHLREGTYKENMEDAKRHGTYRVLSGAEHPRAKLTEEQVTHIRTRKDTTKALASEFGVSPTAIDAVRKGRTWKHLL